MVFEYDKLKQRTRLLVDEALNAVKAGFSDDDANLRPLELTQLEQRILMSASPMAAVAEAVDTAAPEVPVEDEFTGAVPVEQTDSDQTSVQQNDAALQSTVELVVIDPSAENYEQLVADIQSQTDREFEVLILNPREDGIAQITDALQELRDVSAIHLVSHGDEGEVLLGASVLSQRTIGRYAAELVTWQQSMTADADLLIYGCDLTASEDGVELTESLNTLLGADIAASDDLTGHASLGGDWELETTVGTVESALAFTVNIQQHWSGLLSTGGAAAVDGLIVSTSGAVNSPSGAPGLDAWDDGAALKFGGASLDLGSGTTAGSFSQQFDLSNFVDDGNADIDGLHYVSRDIMIGGAGGIQLLAGDILFSTEGTEDVNGGALRLRTEDVGLFRPDTAGDLTSGTVSMLLEDLSIKTGAFLGPAVHGFTLIEQTTTVGDVTLQAGDFLYTNLNDFQADDIMLFETATVGDGNTSGTRSKLVNGVDLGFATSAFLFGIELIETETTIGGTTLSSGTILVQSSGNQSGIGSSNISSSAQDIIALELVTTEIGNGSSSGEASLFFRGSDVGLDSGAESIDAIALSLNHVPGLEIGGPYAISEGQDLSLDASGSSDDDGDALTYAWDLDNDGIYGETNEPVTLTSTVDWATLQSFGIDDDGVYTIGVQVDDGNGGIDTATVAVTVNNSSPVLSTTGVGSVETGSTYTLNLSSTDAGNDTITSWTINWGDGTIETLAGNPSTATHTYTQAGFTYNILVSATDEDGTYLQNELVTPSYPGDSIFRFAPTTGAFVDEFATADGIDGPVDAIIGPDGHLYVASYTSNNVLRYNAQTGALIDTFVAAGSGGMVNAEGLAFGPDGNLYVADYGHNTVKRFGGTTGAFIDNFVAADAGGLDQPYDLAFGPDGNLYVSSYNQSNVLRYDGNTGVFIDEFVTAGLGGLDTPESMTFGPDGNLYVVSRNSDSVIRYNGTTGALIDSFVSAGSGGLDRPNGLHFGPDGNLYVSGGGNNAVLRYDGGTGAFIDTYVAPGAGGLTGPASIAFVPGHQVNVTDANSAPTLHVATDFTIDGVNENETDSQGTRVSVLLNSVTVAASDADGDSVGIAVTSVDDTNGTWEYSTDDGASWTAFGAVAQNSAVVLGAGSQDRVRFVPDLNFAGSESFTFRAWDGSDGNTSGSTGVNASVTGGDSAFSVNTGTATAPIVSVNVVLNFATVGDVADSGGAPGLNSWTNSEIIVLGDPNFAFEPGTSGTLFKTYDLNDYTGGTDISIEAIHEVSTNITVGGVNGTVDLVEGDILFAAPNNSVTYTGLDAVDVTAGKQDIVRFRPSDQTFALVFDEIGTPFVNGFTLVEKDVAVGDTNLNRGDVLLSLGNNKDILLVDVIGAGAGNAVGTSSVLIAGDDIGMGGGAVNIAGIDLIEEDINPGGFALRAGQIVATLDGDDSDVGDNNITVLASDIFLLDVTTTSLGPTSTTAATATVMMEGADLNLDSNAELLTALSYTINFGVRNEPVLSFGGANPLFTEGDSPVLIDSTATVTDVDSGDFAGGILRVELTGNGTADDRIAIRNQGTAGNQVGVDGASLTYEGVQIGMFSGGDGTNPLVISLTSDANEESVSALLQNVTFSNVSSNPFTGDRTIRFSMTDGDGSESDNYFKNVSVQGVNQAATAVTGNYSITEGSSLTLDATGSSDPEGDPLTYQWDLNYDGTAFAADVTGESPTVTWSTLFDSGIRSGDYTIALRASDGSLTSPLTIATLTVNPLSATSVTQSTTTIVADGIIDSAWSDVSPIAATHVVNNITDSTDLSASWRSTWDANNIYFLVEVTDDDLQNDSGASWFHDDNVELYIDADNSRRGAYDSNDFHFGFRVNDPSTVHQTINSVQNTSGVQFQILNNANGYIAEVSVPWTLLGVTPSIGAELGIEVQVTDDDGGGNREGELAWNDDTDQAYQNTALFGKVELVGTTTSTIIVDTTSDVDDGDTSSIAALYADKGGDGEISLREAILAANATDNGVTPDRILFEIADPLTSGAHTINLTSALPDIDQQVIIDGTTEGDFAGSPIIVLDGSAAGTGSHGIRLIAGSDGSTIRGLAINQFDQDGIRINASDNHTIVGNYLGTDAGGVTDLGNGRDGIFLSDSNGNTIGTSSALDRNVIIGNVRDGIRLSNSDSNVIRGNYVGLAADGVQNAGHDDDGIHLSGTSSANIVGGAGLEDGNVIVSNSNNGIEFGATATNNLVHGNFIGLTRAGAALGNSTAGIRLHTDSVSNTIGGINSGEGNQIANNSGYGVSTSGNAALPSANIQIVGNAIFANGGLGIDTGQDGVTTQTEMPEITSAEVDGTDLTVSGTVTGTAGATYQLAFYASASEDPTGHGEAERFLGTIDVTIDGGGGATSFRQTLTGAAVSIGEFVTSTSRTSGSSTTEFAANVQAVAINVVPTAQITPLLSLREGQDLLIDGSGSTDANGDPLSFLWDLDNDSSFGQTNEPTTATATVTWATLQTFGITGPGAYTIGLQVDDGRGGIGTTSTTLTVVPPLGTSASLVISTADDTTTGGTAGSDSWTRGTVVELGNPNLSLTPTTTSGSFSSVFNIDDFVGDGDIDINALHYVTSNITIGSTNSIDLRVGDILFSSNNDETYDGGAITAEDSDVMMFRPDTPGDYSSGTFQKVLSGLDVLAGITDVKALTLVEKDTLIGDELVSRGDLLFTGSSSTSPATNIYIFRTGDVGPGTTAGAVELLIRGTDLGIDAGTNINGLELIEETITIGGQVLAEGELLLSTNSAQTGIGSTSLSFVDQDVIRLSVAATTLNVGAATGTATAFLTGAAVGLDSGAEEVNAFSLAGFAMNSAPTASVATVATITEGDTLSLDGTGSTDPDGESLNYEWDIAYDGTFTANFTTDTVDLTWSQLSALGIDDDGTYDIALRVNDGTGNSELEVVTLTVANADPTISVTGNSDVGSGQTYTLNLNYSDVGNDSVQSWTVNWGDGTIDTYTGAQTAVTHVYTNGGFTNNITYSVTDDDGKHDTSKLVATSNGNSRVYFNESGAESTVGIVSGPIDVVLGPDGLLYVSNFGSNDIDRLDPVTGSFVDTFAISNSGGLDSPSRMAFGPDGSLYVTSHVSGEVLRFGNDGRFLGEFITGLSRPDGIAFDGDGSVYVSDRTSGEIFKYDSITGVQIGTGPFATLGKGTFTDLNFGPNGNLFASNTTDNLIREFDSNGNAVGDFSGGPLTDITAAAGFNWGPDGRLYVADFGGSRLAVYQADGTFVETFGTGLLNPVNLTFTSSLQVKVNDTPVAVGESFDVNEGGTLNETGVADWSSPGWKLRQQILIDNSASPDALTNMPVLVKLHASATDATNIDYGNTRDGGEDLRFVDADGTLLKHEVELWDESGYSYVWVNVPSVDASSASDFIWMYYDQELAADGHSQNEVWNSDYSAVYHLNGNSLESTSNSNHGAIADVFVGSGIVGRAGEFNGTTSQIDLGSDSTVDDIFAGGGTISAWINPDGSGENGYGRILDKASGTFSGGGNADGWAFQVADVTGGNGFLLFEHGFSGGKGEWRTPTGSITQGAWQHVVLTYDSDSASANPNVYINGVLQTLTENKTPSGSARSDAALNLTLGNHSTATSRTFDGLIDEVRIAQTEISADQIAAEYENITGSFASASGTVETGPNGLLANDSDREGDPLSVSLVSGPANAASFSLNSDGSFNYVHDGSETTGDSFTYTVNDGTTTSAPVTVNLTITPQNDAPVVSAIGSQSSPEDATIGPLAFTVSDAESAEETLTVTATSDNQTLIADSGIVLGGSGSNRTITLTPVANATGGPATITVNVSDGVTTTQMTFQVTLTATNDAPTITPIGDTTTPEDTAVGPIAFTVQDAETAAGLLTVSAFSSDQSLVKDADIVISGTGANRTISFVPVANAVGGPATITVRVSDGVETSSSTFDVTVTPSNDPPEISAISDVTVDEDTEVGPVRFTVSDVDNPAGDLTVTATSSDQSLVADSDITLLGTGTDRRIRLSPQANVSGTTTITLAVSDGGVPTLQTFDVTFDAVDDAPTIGLIPDVTTAEDTTSSTVSFVVGDIDSAAAAMSISAVSVNQSIVADGDIVLGGIGPNRTISFTPAANASGEVELVVTLSDGTTSVDRVFKAIVTPVNDLPAISSIANQTIDEDTPSASLPFSIGDVETSAGALIVTATSNNQSIIADGDIVISGTGASRSVQFTPVKDAHGGPVRITLDVSDGTATTTEFFDVMVNPVNDRPQIDAIANVVTLEDTVTGTFTFGISDAESNAGSLVVSAVSSDQSLVADSGIALGGTEANRTISISPVANAHGGPATITVSVSDGVNVSTETFRIRVTPVNDAPGISTISNVTTTEDTAVGPYRFTISDVENTAGTLIVTATSDDQSVVRDSDIILGGTGANRTISFTPAPNANGGPATITVRVFDGTTATTEAFEVTVTPANDPPTVATIPNVTIDEDTTAGPYTFAIGDVDDDAAALTVMATSSNQGLIADAGIVLGGVGANRTITVTPLANASGTATITVVVSDGRESVLSTFEVTVTPVNDAPEIAAIPDATTAEDTPIGPYTFSIGDVETAVADLVLTATSSDQDIVADSAITLGGTAGNRTISISPGRNAFGTVTITLTVSDGATTTLQTFDLTVTAVNDAPVISAIADLTIDEDAVTGPLAFTVRDIDDLNRTLTVTATSSNQDLIADGDISFTGTGTNRNLIFKPVKDQFGGPVTISFVVSDGEFDRSTDFVVNVRPVNDAPEFSPGTKHNYFVEDDFTLELSDPVLLDGVTDAENDQVSVVLVTGPTYGELTLKEDGSFTYIAEVGYQGIDFFEFSVTDGKANSRTERVSLILPVTVPLPIATNAAGPISLPENNTVSESSGSDSSESVSEETEVSEELAEPTPESLPIAAKPEDASSTDDEELIPPPVVQDDEEEAAAIYNPVRVSDDSGSDSVSSAGSIDLADADRVLANALSFDAMAAGNAETLGVGIQTGDSVFFTSVNYESFSEVKGAVDEIEHLKETLDSQIDLSGVAVNTVAATGTAVVVSAVVTAIRTGVLALGFLTQLPIWTMFDPLMVMDGASGEEGDSLQEIVDRNAREAEKNKAQDHSKDG